MRSPHAAPAIEVAIQHHRAARLAEAEAAYRRILEGQPDHFDALHLLGVISYQKGKHDEAVRLISRAVEKDPSAFPALNNLGLAYRALNDSKAARDCFERAVSLQPKYVDAHNNLALLLQMQGDLDAAAAEFREVLSLRPDFADAHFHLGNIFWQQAKLDEAVSSYKRALALNPEMAAAHCSLAKVLEQQGRHVEALAGYRAALAFDPRLAEAHAGLASMLQDQGLIDEALASYRTAPSLKPDYVEARWQMAMSQLALSYGPGEDPEKSRNAFARELDALDRWFDADREKDGFKAVGSQQPYYLAYHASDNLGLLSQYGSLCARLMKRWQDDAGLAAPAPASAGGESRPIRVGIVSAYIRDHSVWGAIAKGWCEHLDSARFALHVFKPGDVADAETDFARSRAAFFMEGTRELRAWVEAILDQRLDVILYPEIGMDPMTLKLASMGLALVQAASWGHPQTTGLPTIDYYLSAEDFEPENGQDDYRERLIELPRMGCCYHPLRPRAVDVDLPALGIDATSPLLVCPGTPYKYDPRHDRVFIEIAKRLKRCRFLFFHDPYENVSMKLQKRLESSFAQQGLEFGEYGTFIPRQPLPAFYGILKRADLYLDTMGFSGFNTVMQAIECGLPVVTFEGRYMRGRFGVGILRRMGLPELIAQTEDQYAGIAVKLARGADDRREVRAAIEARRDIVVDDVGPIRALEAFLLQATERAAQASAA